MPTNLTKMPKSPNSILEDKTSLTTWASTSEVLPRHNWSYRETASKRLFIILFDHIICQTSALCSFLKCDGEASEKGHSTKRGPTKTPDQDARPKEDRTL